MRHALPIIVLVTCAGCGPEARPQVEGSATYRGQPLANQTLTLCILGDQPEDTIFHRVRLGPDGTFKGDAPAPGLYKVAFEVPLSALEGAAPDDEAMIPAKYRSAKTTDLEWKIERGQNKKDFELAD